MFPVGLLNVDFDFVTPKTVAMHFCRLRGPHPNPNLLLGNRRISCVDTTCYLGLVFDSRLTWRHTFRLRQLVKKRYPSFGFWLILLGVQLGTHSYSTERLYFGSWNVVVKCTRQLQRLVYAFWTQYSMLGFAWQLVPFGLRQSLASWWMLDSYL